MSETTIEKLPDLAYPIFRVKLPSGGILISCGPVSEEELSKAAAAPDLYELAERAERELIGIGSSLYTIANEWCHLPELAKRCEEDNGKVNILIDAIRAALLKANPPTTKESNDEC